ncbi:AAA family ATPase [Microbispora cellulosiformans]|uniref:AAA family ATPase n=1 Tax=Microbispora cellulosiformans TaxID=2614688 RepID=A0A5J5JUR4_9ACTN|nr:LuxR family transcriptional regulator [Microbispora cellulosiformans]KAA9373789.1 AAA family ATPase [Microbispora cellulosiformans]
MNLIERDEALASLQEMLAAALTGKGKVAMLSGTVATGKSALLDAFAEQAVELGALPVAATASRMEQDLPLGVLGQLIEEAPLVEEERVRALALLEEGKRTAMSSGLASETLDQVDAQIAHALCTVLLELSERYPLVIVVDDVHYADRPSLLCLAYLARRVRFARIMVIFSYSDYVRSTDTFFWTDLLRQPYCGVVQLNPLSRQGVHTLVRERAGEEVAVRFAEDWYAYSAGNPLLAAALIEDYLGGPSARERDGEPAADEPVVGERYGQAVLTCLHRGEPELLRIARCLAVLGETDSLDRLLGLGHTQISRAMNALTAGGVLSVGRFRHESARTAVLAEVGLDERRDLHRRAAGLAHADGAATSVIADHLVQAGPIDAPWVVPVLEDAARDALREGRTERGVDYLRLAWQACTDERRRLKIATMLVRAEWRINPEAPDRHLADLTEAMQRGHLRGGDGVVLARALLWHGRYDDAQDVIEHLTTAGYESDPETVMELNIARPWLRATHPAFASKLGEPRADTGTALVSVAAGRRLETATALAQVLVNGPHEGALIAVERILRLARLDEMSMDTVECALLALTYGGQAEKAAPLCDLFSVEASSRRAPSRQARLSAIRAEMAVRQGDMVSAEQYARAALEIMPITSWGVTVGSPLGSLVIALTAMGRFDDVHDILDRPVLDAMFESRYGLHYLYARGRYSLAVGQAALALRDFQLCGELTGRWGLDVPGLLPWRAGAAEACLQLGRTEQAAKLIEDQLSRCNSRTPRELGMTIRLLAATSELRHRPMLLRKSADMLQNGGDRYEQARSLFDLAEAYRGLGEHRRVGMIMIRARALMKECGAEIGGPQAAAETGKQTAPALSGGSAALLSEAERRVAVLAAAGHTNREIAGELYLTVSTVEQHLTRIYRKLDITSRADLPAVLEFGGAAVG